MQGPRLYQADDVNVNYFNIMMDVGRQTVLEDTRNGPANVWTEPVLISSILPYQRVIFDPVRDANPFFHYLEAIWMLSGSEEIDLLTKLVPNMIQYSDDKATLHGAYGYRWRYAFDQDQLETVKDMLIKDPGTRRAVVSMWDPHLDLDRNGKDLPCNTHLYFRRNTNGYLSMTVCNRSNDLVYGAMGANVVHMSILLEYMALRTGMPMGPMYQFTNNLHVYEQFVTKFSASPSAWYIQNPMYNRMEFSPLNFNYMEAIDFVSYAAEREPDLYNTKWKSPILNRMAQPMLQAWHAHKAQDDERALRYIDRLYDEDWRKACKEWIQRRVMS